MKKIQFSIVSYFDPFGDLKSERKVLSKENYESEKNMEEIEDIIEKFNDGKYYNAVKVGNFNKNKKEIKDFDNSRYLTSKAHSASYQSIPGY